MKKTTLLVFLALLLSVGTNTLFAKEHHHKKSKISTIDKREKKQLNRINKGIASGQLNAEEKAKLLQDQAKIANMEANAKADGKMSKKERVAIKKTQNAESKKIYKLKHNRSR